MPLQPAAAPLRGFDVKLRTRSHVYRFTTLTLFGLVCAAVITRGASHG